MNKVYLKNTFVLLLLLSVNNVYAQNTSVNINSLQDKILNSNTKLSSVEQDIKNIDIQISKKVLLLEEINAELLQSDTKKSQLSLQKQQSIESLAKQKTLLLKQLEVSYVLNRSSSIQKLSNINNLQQLNRFLTYLESYQQFNHENIKKIKSSIQDIEKLDINLTSINSQQQQNKQKVIKSFEELKLLKANNIELKNKLQASLNTELSRLDYYQKQYNKLNEALNNEALAKETLTKEEPEIEKLSPNNPKLKGLFKNAKGHLSLPVSGLVDTSSQNTIKTKNAIFIKTAEGKKVKAVFGGTVVFSNWLRGFGFLTIVDHGHGYMSLYGNNQTLLKSTGNVVEAGESIAITGSSGGVATPGLYFEIRHNGSAINTLTWLKGDIGRALS